MVFPGSKSQWTTALSSLESIQKEPLCCGATARAGSFLSPPTLPAFLHLQAAELLPRTDQVQVLSMSPVRSGFPQEQHTWHTLLWPWMLLYPGRGTCSAGRMARTSPSQVLGRCVGSPPGARSRRSQPVPARQPGCSPAPCACSGTERRELWREALAQAERGADVPSMSQDCPRTPDGNSSWREPRPACQAAGSLNTAL